MPTKSKKQKIRQLRRGKTSLSASEEQPMDRSTVDACTILLVNAGSHAYGTSTPTSDRDIRGIMIPPADYILGMRRVDQYQEVGMAATETTPERPDLVIYELRKYLVLAADANPNILELLFVDDSDVLATTKVGDKLRAHRHLFLSKKAKHTFSGYAMSQLKRIESHRRWLLNPPTAPPCRQDFGLPERTVIPKDQLAAAEALVRKQVEAWENVLPTYGVDVIDPAAAIQMRELLIAALTEMRLATDEDRFLAAARHVGLDDNFLDLLDRERRYVQKKREWDAFRQWCEGRNEARAELERKHGFDTKNAMHLVRLKKMALEIGKFGEVRVFRDDAAELLAIRNGAWSHTHLMQWSKDQDDVIDAVYEASTLPKQPDHDAINALCVEIIEAELQRRRSKAS